jgi:hypothetical protein
MRYKFYLGKGLNLFNPQDAGVELNTVLTIDGKTSSNLYNTTGNIALSGVPFLVVKKGYRLKFFDEQGSSVSFKYAVLDQNYTMIRVPDGASYARISTSIPYWDKLLVYSMILSRPIYGEDLSKDYELETEQQFYRAKLSGTLSYLRDDFDYINSSPFDSEFLVDIFNSNPVEKDVPVPYFSGKFTKTDCTFNLDDKKVSTSLTTVDEYTDILAGLEKEYDLIPLTPVIQKVDYSKRPLIQIYVPGDSLISCFLGGTYWEQEATPTTDNSLYDDFHFTRISLIKELTVTGTSIPAVNGVYYGSLLITQYSGYNMYEGNLIKEGSNYYINVRHQYGTQAVRSWYEIRRNSDNQVVFDFEGQGWHDDGDEYFDTGEFDFIPRNGSSGSPHASIYAYRVLGRFICDRETIGANTTFPIPEDDITSGNKNYHYCMPFSEKVVYVSSKFSDTPTEWGRADNGKYYLPPDDYAGFYPIGRSTWRGISLWYFSSGFTWSWENSATATQTLNDAYPVWSCLSVLLGQIAPEITHNNDTSCSEFLYGESNPISGLKFSLLVTPKSNILNSIYEKPALKAKTTMQQFLTMLRNCFQCFWHIENGKLRIEHISWYNNGGTYVGSPLVGIDLTGTMNIRNGKAWSYMTSAYTFDKQNMPERYQFSWMDDVTTPFEGFPIEILNKYVEEGNIEEITVGNFTTDIDFMLLNPDGISQDGFALLAARFTIASRTGKVPFTLQPINGVNYSLQNGYLAFINLQEYWLYSMPAKRIRMNGSERNSIGITKNKKQTLNFPCYQDPNLIETVKTELGEGKIEKISINFSSRIANATLKYDTE